MHVVRLCVQHVRIRPVCCELRGQRLVIHNLQHLNRNQSALVHNGCAHAIMDYCPVRSGHVRFESDHQLVFNMWLCQGLSN